MGVPEQRHVGKRDRGTYGHDFRIGLGVHQTWKAIAGLTADARAVRHVGLVHHDGGGRGERMVARSLKVIEELLNARLAGDRRARIGRAGRRLGRIASPQPVDVVHLLGLGVIRLQVLIVDRPRWRDAIVVADLLEVPLPQAIERGAEHLAGAADEIVHLRLKRLAVAVVPGVGRDVAVLLENGRRIPVQRLALEPVAALKNQNALPRGRELACQRTAARSAADDDDVEMLVHGGPAGVADLTVLSAWRQVLCRNVKSKATLEFTALRVSFDSEVRKRPWRRMMRTPEPVR